MTKKFKLTKDMQSKSIKKAALAYAEYGLPVFPVFGIDEDRKCLCGNNKCESQGKHPILAGGYKTATTNLKQIEKWWEEQTATNNVTDTCQLPEYIIKAIEWLRNP